MSNTKSIILNLVFNLLIEYLATPVVVSYIPWLIFFPQVSLMYTFLFAVWLRISLELVVKTIADTWYTTKFSRSK